MRRAPVRKVWTPDGPLPLVPEYQFRFIREEHRAALSNLWHLSRTACAKPGGYTRHDRMVWTAAAFAKEHPYVSSTAAYKDLDGMLENVR